MKNYTTMTAEELLAAIESQVYTTNASGNPCTSFACADDDLLIAYLEAIPAWDADHVEESFERLCYVYDVDSAEYDDLGDLLEAIKAACKARHAETKRVYVAVSARNDGDSYDIAVSFDRAEAVEAIENQLAHLTKAERERSTNSVQAWDIPVIEGQTAKGAYHEWCIEQAFTPDPAEYEEF